MFEPPKKSVQKLTYKVFKNKTIDYHCATDNQTNTTLDAPANQSPGSKGLAESQLRGMSLFTASQNGKCKSEEQR